MIENKLKNRLARIKKRAMWLRQKAEAREDASATGPLAADDPERTAAPNEIVDEVVKTGAVVRGKDFDKIATLRKRWRRQRRDDASNDFEEEKGREEHPLARFRTGDPQPLESVAPGVVSGSGERSFYLVNARGNEIDPDAAKEARVLGRHNDWPEDVRVSYPGMRRAASSKLQEALPRILFDPERVLFLDIETAGLSAGTYLFLVGMMFLDGDEFVVDQAFARDYSEEAGVLEYVRETARRFDAIVTYNGASFDLPFIRTRMAIHRIPDLERFGSVDLLYTARRVFRDILPNRRLVTVERHLRRIDLRHDDIPSRFIPEAYHDYVRTGDARAMRNVLYHNLMDIFTMAVLVNRLHDREVPAERS